MLYEKLLPVAKGAPSDPYFEYNTLLLTGDGTNGAQNNTFLASNGAAQGPFADPAGYWSAQFDGSGDYLTTSSNAAFDFSTGDFTIESWIYLNSVPSSATIIDTRNGDVLGAYMLSVLTSSKLDFIYSSSRVTSSATVPLNSWVHVAVSRASGTIKLFINGVVDANTASYASAINATSFPSIGGGRASASNTVSGYYVNGYLSNLRIVKGTAVYTSNFTVPTSPLTAISGTSLLACQSNVICDTSSNKFAITANGDAKVNTFSPFTISSTYNPYSFSGYFDGNGDYLSLAPLSAFAFGTSDFTVEAWFNISDLGSLGFYIIDARNSAQTSTWALAFDPVGGIKLFWFTGSTSYSSGVTPTLDVWNHLAVSRSGTTLRMFLNGTQIISTTDSTNYSVSPTISYIGARFNNTGNLFGYLSNVRVVKGTALYTSNFTPSNEPLTAISGTSLLTCQSSTFVDNSPNNFTITVNGNTTVATASNSGLPITRNGNTTQGTFSPYGDLWSNYFDGSGDYLTTPSNAVFNVESGNYTVEFWMNLGVVPTNLTAVVASFNSSNGGSFFVGIVSSKLRIITGNDTSVVTSTTTTLLPNVWYHVALVRDGSTSMKTYLNGVLEVSSTSFNWTGSTQPCYIGTYNGGTQYINGYISNLRVVKGTALYTSNFTPSTTPLTAVSGTSLLTCQSNRFKDNSSNNFTLTVNGNTSVQRFSPFNPTAPYSAATIGGSGYFDGTGDRLDVAQTSQLALTGDFTIECWWYATATTDPGYLFDFRVSGPTTLAYIYLDNSIDFYLNGSQYIASLGETSPYYRWNHFVATRSGSSLSLYHNGVRIANATNSSSGANSTCRIGDSYVADRPWKGYLADFRVVKGSSVYNPASTTITVPTAPLTAITNTSLLCNFTNAGIPDAAMMNDLETVGNAQVSTSVKKYGTGSLAFDGTGDGLFAASSPNFIFGTGDFTVEFWINIAANLGNFVKIIQMGTSATSFTIETQSTTNLLAVTNYGASVILYSGSALTTNTWTHFAVTRASGTLRIFQNGTQTASTSDSTNFTNGNVYIGQSSIGQAMNGYIDDLRITKGYARYTASFTPPTAALPVY